jgi:hypothetical protein
VVAQQPAWERGWISVVITAKRPEPLLFAGSSLSLLQVAEAVWQRG